MAAVDEVAHAIKTFNKAVDTVLQYPRGPQRWRAANNLWLSLSFRNQRIYREVCKDNATTRDLVNKHGEAIGLSRAEMADKSLRNALNIPTGAYIAITKADPDVFKEKKNSELFFKEFREYTTRSTF
jgi:hypothetical protein